MKFAMLQHSQPLRVCGIFPKGDRMGLIINKNAILCSGFTAAALWFGVAPMYAFFLGAFLLYMPFRILFGTNVVSQTGAISSVGTILAHSWLEYSLFNSFIIGAVAGYAFLFWWIFFVPKLFLKNTSLV